MNAPAEPAEREGARDAGGGGWRDVGHVLALFLASKAFIVIVALLATLLFSPGNYYKGRATDIGWLDYATRWDTGWYIQIATEGYRFDAEAGKGNVAFFPLFPLLMRGVIACGVHPVVAGAAIANVCFFVALLLFFRFVRGEFGRRPLAQHATALLAFSPGLAWFSIGYTESLFLALTLGLILALRSGRWAWAIGLGVLAGLSRPNAVVLIAPMLFLGWPPLLEAWRKRTWGRFSAVLGGVGSPVIGHALYLAFLQFKFGNWKANHVVELKGWSAQIKITWEVIQQKIPGVGLHLFNNPEIFREHVSWTWFILVFVTVFSLIVLWEHRARAWLSIFILGFVGLYVSIEQLGGPVYSVGRFAAQIFPFYLAMALFAEKRAWAQSATLAASVMWATITGLMLFGGYHIN